MASQKQGGEHVAIEVQAELRDIQMASTCGESAAYAYSRGGHLLDRARLQDGRAKLSVPVAGSQDVRVMVGPAVDDEEPRISMLQRRGAVEEMVRLDDDLLKKLQFQILPHHWKVWWLTCCVPGTLLKRTEVDGVPVDLPVCNATVEVYEVDPIFLIIPKIPDLVIEEIREWIIHPPIPEPDPPFPPQPDPPFPPQPGPTPPPREFRAAPEKLQMVARSSGLTALKAELVLHADWTRWILCWKYPRWVRMDKICETKTDACGRFTCCFFRGFHNPDTPDLYFKAKQKFLGWWPITIYEPKPVSCHTHWNYKCGTEVTLYTNSLFASTCPPCPPVEAPLNWAMFTAIGNMSLDRIHGASDSLDDTTTGANEGLTETGAPFGGVLRPRLDFDNSLRGLGIHYYRISWRRGTSGPWAELNEPVNRRYTHEVNGELVIESYDLGPNVVGAAANLFEITPPAPEGQWTIVNAVTDTQSGVFDTVAGAESLSLDVEQAAGKYQLKVELFDQAGVMVDLHAVGKEVTWVVPDVPNLNGTISTTEADDLDLVSGDAFVMTLHIDNNPCTSVIDEPQIGGDAANACGVLEYGPTDATVSMSYEASHPNGFATHQFVVNRGATTVHTATASHSGSFTTSADLSTLRGTCPTAGFAASLATWARATNGWSRLHALDAHALRGFVLTPETTP